MSTWNISAQTLVPIGGPAALYVVGRARIGRRGVRWPVRRDVAFTLGLLCIALAIASPLAADDERFSVHAVQHLLLGMVAPLAFACAAPVTLLLRAGSASARRRLVAVLSSPTVRALSWAPVGAALSVAGMVGLYLTPLYDLTLRSAPLHEAVHAHMLLTGCLFAFALVGVDPMPGRGSFGVRVGSLLAALAVHDVLAKYLYLHPGGHADSVVDSRRGAQVMWYGGEAIDIAVAVVLFAQWYAAGGRELARNRRRRRTVRVVTAD